MEKIIGYYKNYEKQKYLTTKYHDKYAFVGIGSHSISNLYPVINYLRIPLKYILVKSAKNADLISKNFECVIGTNDENQVFNDDEVKNVFISSNPKSHFKLVKKALESSKNVFIEKPPCLNLEELKQLIEIEKNSTGFCMVGLQKRHAPVIQLLKKKKLETLSYNYKFITGAYPEGNPILDLFIHPIDLLVHLFGDYTIMSVNVSNKDTFFIHLKHDKFIGSIELSTQYSWEQAEEKLVINTKAGIYDLSNMEHLTFQKKPGTLFSIPLEKVTKSNPAIETLFSRNNFSPILENNQLFTSGYFNEIDVFSKKCTNNKIKNNSSLTDIISTYKLIDHLNSL